jgi:predicted GIY-YIG superfamily endonuclease
MISDKVLAAPHFVYRLFDAAGALLYVGCTHDPKKRLRSHARKQPWWPEVARVDHSHPMPLGAARRLESIAINAENPRYNVAGRLNPVQDSGPGPVASRRGQSNVLPSGGNFSMTDEVLRVC